MPLIRSCFWNFGVRSFLVASISCCPLAASQVMIPSLQYTPPKASTSILVAPSTDLLSAALHALQTHPALKQQKAQVEVAQGSRLIASSVFDAVTSASFLHTRTVTPLTSYQALSFPDGATTNLNQTQLSVEVDRLFRNGIQSSAQYAAIRNIDNLSNSAGENTSVGAFTITFPLLRGRGHVAVASQEDAATIEITAAQFDVDQLISQLVLNVATSYWNTVASRKRYDIARSAEDRGAQYLSYVQALVKGDQVPRNDLNQAEANFATRTSNRVVAEQNLWTAERQLALDAGLSGAEVMAGLQPSEEFARPLQDLQDSPEDSDFYVSTALRNRADLQAAKQRVQESQRLVAGAKTDLRPTLNLVGGANYAGLVEGRSTSSFLTGAIRGAAAPGYSAGVNFVIPGSREAARGSYQQSQAILSQRSLSVQDFDRQIRTAVVIAVTTYRISAEQVRAAQRSVDANRSALTGEQEKYKAGLSSITDVLVVEDRLNASLGDLVQAQLSLSLAIAQFRFDTGLLVTGSAAGPIVEASSFRTLPFAGSATPTQKQVP